MRTICLNKERRGEEKRRDEAGSFHPSYRPLPSQQPSFGAVLVLRECGVGHGAVHVAGALLAALHLVHYLRGEGGQVSACGAKAAEVLEGVCESTCRKGETGGQSE